MVRHNQTAVMTTYLPDRSRPPQRRNRTPQQVIPQRSGERSTMVCIEGLISVNSCALWVVGITEGFLLVACVYCRRSHMTCDEGRESQTSSQSAVR